MAPFADGKRLKGLRTDVMGVLAVVRLTLREVAWRPSALVLVLLTAVAIALTPWLPSVDAGEGSAVKLTASASFGIIFAVLMLAVALTAPIALGEDVESRRVWLAISKPISRWGYMLGRALGFLMALLLLSLILTSAAGATLWAHAGRTKTNMTPSPLHLPATILPKISQPLRWLTREGDSATLVFEGLSTGESPFDLLLNPRLELFVPRERGVGAFIDVTFGPAVESRSTAVPVPVRYEIVELAKARVAVPPGAVTEDGTMVVTVGLAETGPRLLIEQDSIVLQGAKTSFAGNLFSAALLFFCQAAVVALIAVAAGSAFSLPVALFLTLTFTLGGSAVDIVRQVGHANDTSAWMREALNIIAFLMPDFPRANPTGSIVESVTIPCRAVALAALNLPVIYGCAALGLGYLASRRREL